MTSYGVFEHALKRNNTEQIGAAGKIDEKKCQRGSVLLYFYRLNYCRNQYIFDLIFHRKRIIENS